MKFSRGRLTNRVLGVYAVIFIFLFSLLFYVILNPLEPDADPDVIIRGNAKIVNGTTTMKVFDDKTLELLDNYNRVMIDCSKSDYCIKILKQNRLMNILNLYASFTFLLIIGGYIVYDKTRKINK